MNKHILLNDIVGLSLVFTVAYGGLFAGIKGDSSIFMWLRK